MALADCGIPLRSRLAGLNQMMRADTFICWWIQRSLTHALGKGLATWNIAELEHFHKKPYFNLPSDLPCIGFDSVKLIIIKKINNHISANSWIRWQDRSTVSQDFSMRMGRPHNSNIYLTVSALLEWKGAKKRRLWWWGICYTDQ